MFTEKYVSDYGTAQNVNFIRPVVGLTKQVNRCIKISH